MKNSLRVIFFLVVLGGARGASAQNPVPWDGFYFGVNAGEASPHSCHTVTPVGAAVAASAALTTSVCAGGEDLVGGVQFGENFQYKRFVVGLGADIDLWNSKNQSHAVKYVAAAEAGAVQAGAVQAGALPPSGTYTESGKLAPRAFGIIGPRIGYAGDTWLPYLRMGALLTGGTRTSSLYYTAPSAVNPAASFSSGKNFSSTGWVAGGGTEIGLNGAWSITLEFLHASLGKPTDFSASCAGSVTACTAFSGIAFDSVHDHFTANIFRVGVTYWFSYWNL